VSPATSSSAWQSTTPGAGVPSSRYQITRLVYFESTANARSAIAREKEIKRWSRKKKIALIEAANPYWLDLADHWFEGRHRDSSLRSE
jgi:putative endonuclease